MGHLKHKGRKKWEICIELGRDPRTGKRQRKYKTINGTKQKAQKKMAEMIDKYKTGNFLQADKATVKEYLRKWLKEYAKSNVSERTFQDYKGVINNHLLPYFGKLKLGDLQSRHIIKYQSDKLENGRLDGTGGLSKRSVENHHRILSQALKHAVHTYKILESNPCEGVQAPKPDDPEINPLSKKQAKQLLNQIKDDKIFYSLIYVALYTGLRRGEILALRWKDVDIDKKVLEVRRSASEIRGQGVKYKNPKNTSSKRAVNFDDDVAHKFKFLKKKQLKYYNQDAIIFLDESGQIIRPDYVTKRFKKEVKKLGLDEIRFHDLRHTHATWLLKLGVNPKVVQERLGHYDISTTLNKYSHVTASIQKNAVEMLKNTKKSN